MNRIPRIIKLTEISRPPCSLREIVDWDAVAITDEKMPHGYAKFGVLFKKFPAGWKASIWTLVQETDETGRKITWPERGYATKIAAASAIMPQVWQVFSDHKKAEKDREDLEKKLIQFEADQREDAKQSLLRLILIRTRNIDTAAPINLYLLKKMAEDAARTSVS